MGWSAPLVMAGAVLCFPAVTLSFQRETEPAAKGKPADQEVVIKREVLRLTDPKVYRVSMHLQPARSLILTAPIDGYVRGVSAKPQQKLNQQAEAVRLDDRRSELVLKRAKAGLLAAQLEKKIAQGKGDADQVALAEARIEAAQADVELAQLDVDRLVIRAPFNGEVERVLVTEGQFVRAGDGLATLVDNSRLTVEVPVDRNAATVGGNLEIKVEDSAVQAQVEAVMPLSPQFEALRELTTSPASAIVSVSAGAGKFLSGQTVYSEMIPLTAVTVVPTLAVLNSPDGNRKVQVLRENVVRELAVRILGKVGTDSVFVSGRFHDGDELIVSSTRTLEDGTPLRAATGAGPVESAKGGTPRSEGASPGGGTKKPSVGF
jgi:RND family efflux transporter MFP subunit